MIAFRYTRSMALFALLLASQCLLAAPEAPVPFSADYEVRFVKGFRAEADMTLNVDEEGLFHLDSEARLKIFGRNVTTVIVNGQFSWEDDKIIPQTYQYIQKGIGKKTRSIDYDWANHDANIIVKRDELVLPLPIEGAMFDELHMYMEIQQQAAAGVEDIFMDVIDEDEIKNYQYHRLGEEQLETDLGLFNTVKYERVRGEGSKRKTQMWLATDWNYIVLRLTQKTTLRTFSINLLDAKIDEVAVVPLAE